MSRRRYSVKSRSIKKGNWSHENKGCRGTFGETVVNTLWQAGSIVVPAINTQGVRTVGNWSITVPVSTSSGALNNEWYWALVYVPQGTNPNTLFATTGDTNGSLYEPNQYVIACGISDDGAGPIRIRSRIMRKLHSGDSVSLIVGSKNSLDPTQTVLNALVSYSVKYN